MTSHTPGKAGFTLIELMIVVAIIAILATVAVTNYQSMVQKSRDATTLGNLGTLRSALGIYFSDNNESYPVDDLTSIAQDSRYMEKIPIVRAAAHVPTMSVFPETGPTDSGFWSYDNDSNSSLWGHITVGCLHDDARGVLWSSY